MILVYLTRIVAGRFGGLLLLCWVLTGLHVLAAFLSDGSQAQPVARSEERRVGKECA